MFSQLVVAALAVSVSANIVVPGHIAINFEHQNVARQTDSASASSGLSDAACQTELLSVAASLPTPAAALESYVLSLTTIDPCSESIPSSLSKDYSKYYSAVESWYTKSSSAIYSILSECPQYAAETSDVPVCSTVLAAITSDSSAATATGSASGSSAAAATGSASGTSAKGTAAASSASASSSATAKSGASAREVGIVGAVLAGVLGVAVAL